MENSVKLPITSLIFKACIGGNITWKILTACSIMLSWNFTNRSNISEKLCDIIYTIRLTIIVIMLLINVEKKKTIASSISSFKKVKNNAHRIRCVIPIPLRSNTHKNNNAWKITIKAIVPEKPKNFPRIKSCLLIGLESMRNIVFPSTSLNNNWLPTNNTQIRPKTSIIPRPKSTITFSLWPIVNSQRAIENRINTKAKNKIKYKNLFLTISLKVFLAIFSIVWYFWKYSSFLLV